MDNNFNQNNQYNNNAGYNQFNQQPQMTPEQWQWYQYQEAENNKKANTLCIISLLCEIIPIVSIFLLALMGDVSIFHVSDDAPDFVQEMISTVNMLPFYLIGCMQMVGFVLMIIARVKYPRNKFAKVLMVLFIIGIILYVIAMIAVVVSCVWLFSQCIP